MDGGWLLLFPEDAQNCSQRSADFARLLPKAVFRMYTYY